MAEISPVHQKIIDAVRVFEEKLMAAHPTTITVNESNEHLFVMLDGAISQAERRYGEEDKSRRLLEELYSDVFNAVKSELMETLSQITGRPVARSSISIDPAMGTATLVFAYKGDSRAESVKPD